MDVGGRKRTQQKNHTLVRFLIIASTELGEGSVAGVSREYVVTVGELNDCISALKAEVVQLLS